MENNHGLQRREDYEQYFKVGSEWGVEFAKIRDALAIYQLRCNVSLLGKGNSSYRHFSCKEPGCTFMLCFNLSFTGFRITRYSDHSCEYSLEIKKRRLNNKTISNLIKLPTSIDLDAAQPKEIKNLIEDQCMMHPDVSDETKNRIASRLLKDMATQTAYEGIGGISDFKSRFQELDGDNAFIIDTVDGRYVRSQIIIGSVKRLLLSNYSLKRIDFDGSHHKRSQGILLGMSILDSNNEIHLLSLAHESREESVQSWDGFFHSLQMNIPSLFDKGYTYMSDRDRGIMNLVDSLENINYNYRGIECSFSICVLHLKRNIYHISKSNTAAQQKRLNQLINPIIYAKNPAIYKKSMVILEKENKMVYNYLIKIPKQKYVWCFNPRTPILTNNSIESLWNWLGNIRRYRSITKIYIEVVNKTISKIEQELLRATKHKGEATPFSDTLLLKLIEDDKPKFMKYKLLNQSKVKTDDGIFTIDLRERKCSCNIHGIASFPCSHLLFGYFKYGSLGNVKQIIDPKYLTTAWRESLNRAKPFNHIPFVINNLKSENEFAEPEYGTQRGRPRKKVDRWLPRKSKSSKDTYSIKMRNILSKKVNKKKRKYTPSINKRILSRGEISKKRR